MGILSDGPCCKTLSGGSLVKLAQKAGIHPALRDIGERSGMTKGILEKFFTRIKLTSEISGSLRGVCRINCPLGRQKTVNRNQTAQLRGKNEQGFSH